MIYYLLYPLSDNPAFSFLNVLRYIPFRVIAATMTAMLLTFACIRGSSATAEQADRPGRPQGGPREPHLKAGTPTMGGALILLALGHRDDALGRPAEHLRLGGHGGHRGLRRRSATSTTPRRSSKRSSGGPCRPLQAATAVRHGDRGAAATSGTRTTCRPTGSRSATASRIPFVAFEKHPVELPIWALRAVRGLRRGRARRTP